jgi:hypothetical protein
VFSSLHGTTQPFITAHWQTFKATGSILSLATMLAVIIRQHRTLELLYGGYCQLFHGPSPVEPCEDEAALMAILSEQAGLHPSWNGIERAAHCLVRGKLQGGSPAAGLRVGSVGEHLA